MPLNSAARTPLLIKKAGAALIVAVLSIGFLLSVPCASADDAGTASVPAPHIEVKHQSAFTVDDVTTANDMWSMNANEGDVTILLLARNLTDTRTGTSWIDYQSDINYHVGNNLYIAQITIMEIKFLIGGQAIPSVLKTCDEIGMTCTPVRYDGGLPSFYCNITYSDVGLRQSGSVGSTFNLTLSHHITYNWTQTDIKVEAKFDLSNTKLIDSNTGDEFDAGTPFTIEIPYSMMLTLPNSHGEPIAPSGHTDTNLEYNLTMSSGTPITVSKLSMNNNFTVVNQTGSYAALGYSSLQYGARSQVTHGFPGLVYGDTVTVRSDPEITVYHDRLGGTLGSIPSDVTMYLIVVAVAMVVVFGVLLVVRRRAKSK